MKLLIYCAHSGFNRNKINNLKIKTKLLGISSINIKQCQYFDTVFQKLGMNLPKTYQLILRAFNSLKVHEFEKGYYITFDDTIYVGQYKLVDICRIINYGALDIRAYPIFSYVFNLVKKDITF